jgi:hypothetical protein
LSALDESGLLSTSSDLVFGGGEDGNFVAWMLELESSSGMSERGELLLEVPSHIWLMAINMWQHLAKV